MGSPCFNFLSRRKRRCKRFYNDHTLLLLYVLCFHCKTVQMERFDGYEEIAGSCNTCLWCSCVDKGLAINLSFDYCMYALLFARVAQCKSVCKYDAELLAYVPDVCPFIYISELYQYSVYLQYGAIISNAVVDRARCVPKQVVEKYINQYLLLWALMPWKE